MQTVITFLVLPIVPCFTGPESCFTRFHAPALSTRWGRKHTLTSLSYPPPPVQYESSGQCAALAWIFSLVLHLTLGHAAELAEGGKMKYWVKIPRKINYCYDSGLSNCFNVFISLIGCLLPTTGSTTFLPWSLYFRGQSFGLHWEFTPLATEMLLYLLVCLEKHSLRQESVVQCSQCDNKQK